MRTIVSLLRLFKTRLQIALCDHDITNHSVFKSLDIVIYSVYCDHCGKLLKSKNYTEEQWNKGEGVEL